MYHEKVREEFLFLIILNLRDDNLNIPRFKKLFLKTYSHKYL